MIEIVSLTYKIECQNCQFLIIVLFLVCNGSKSAIVTNTIVEIVVLDCVYGENGSNLALLR